MNFDFSEEERALKEQARRFLEEKATLALDRELLDGKAADRSAELWREVCELGWPGAAIPEAYGGYGLGHVALCAIAEEVGRAAAPLPLLPSIYLAAEALLLAGGEAQKQRWLPELAAGNVIGTVALAGRARENGGVLEGRVAPVPQGAAAAFAIVAAEGADGAASLYLVDLSAGGVERAALHTIDDTQPHAALSFAGVVGEPLGARGAADAILARLKARAAILLAFEQVGGAEACLDMAVAYAHERRSFGKLIGSYQAVKHKLADIFIKKELARSNAYYGAWALANDAPELELAAATARVSATEAYDFASAENVQAHGGIGFTWEADCQLHYRRARLLAHALGVPAEWHDRLVAAIDLQQAA